MNQTKNEYFEAEVSKNIRLRKLNLIIVTSITMATKIYCNDIASDYIDSICHKCNRQRNLRRGSRNSMADYSLNDPRHQRMLYFLYCESTNIRPQVQRITRTTLLAIENHFGTNVFCFCKKIMKTVEDKMKTTDCRVAQTGPSVSPRKQPHGEISNLDSKQASSPRKKIKYSPTNSDSSHDSTNIHRKWSQPYTSSSSSSSSDSDFNDLDSDTETVLNELGIRSHEEDDNRSLLQSVVSPSSTSAQSHSSSNFTNQLAPRRLSPVEKKRRNPTEVFRERFKNVAREHKKVVRKSSQYVTGQVYRRRADTALCHLLCLCGYTSDTQLKKNKECFNSVSALISSVKARLSKYCELTLQEAVASGEIYEPTDPRTKDAEDELRFFGEAESEHNQEEEEESEQKQEEEETQSEQVEITNNSEETNAPAEVAKCELADQLMANLAKHRYNHIAKIANRAFGTDSNADWVINW